MLRGPSGSDRGQRRVEDASRFARELMAQELGITLLISRAVRLLMASGDDLTASDDPTRKMMRQIGSAFAEYEKARLVSKLRHARERVRNEKGKCEGRKAHAELRPDVGSRSEAPSSCQPENRRASQLSADQLKAGEGRVPERQRAALQPEKRSGNGDRLKSQTPDRLMRFPPYGGLDIQLSVY
jgi:hypothetical protein